MHTKCLGTDSYLLGSLIQCLVEQNVAGTEEENLEQLWQEMQEEYKKGQTRSRFNQLAKSMCKQAAKKAYPCLKGKASEIKHLLQPLQKICQRRLDDSEELEKRMLQALRFSVEADKSLEQCCEEPRLPEMQAKRFQGLITNINLVTTELGLRTNEMGMPLFHFTIKSQSGAYSYGFKANQSILDLDLFK
eukprot:3224492-Amphidinium_carterae.2